MRLAETMLAYDASASMNFHPKKDHRELMLRLEETYGIVRWEYLTGGTAAWYTGIYDVPREGTFPLTFALNVVVPNGERPSPPGLKETAELEPETLTPRDPAPQGTIPDPFLGGEA